MIGQILFSQVNRAMLPAPVGNKSADAGSPQTFMVSATDPDGSSLTYSATNLPTNATFNPTTRTFAWTPTTAQVGTSLVTLGVGDSSRMDSESGDPS